MSLISHFFPLKSPFYNRETGNYEFVGEDMENGHSRTNTLQLSEEQVLKNKTFAFEQSTNKKAWQQNKKYSRDISKKGEVYLVKNNLINKLLTHKNS